MQDGDLAGVTAAVQRAANYRGKAFPQTHPDRLATVARLHGLAAKDPRACRVLELGCGDGGNVIPLAFDLPNSEFVGIDLAADRVEMGASWARQLGLTNIKLEARDISDIADEYGKFDYIVAHGVYCWVPAPVRDRLFEVCQSLLQPEGVAFVSFNAKPGWHFLEYLRDFALLAARHGGELAPDVLLKNIRGLAQLYAQELPGEGGLAQHLKELYARLAKTSDYLLAFDYLGEISQPVALGDFVAHAQRFGLHYLSDANYFETEWRNLPKRVRGALASLSNDPIARESFADCFTARLFRRALLCRREVELRAPTADDVASFQILGNLKALDGRALDTSENPVSFEMLHGARLTISSPIVKAALTELATSWPTSLSLAELASRTARRLPQTAAQDPDKVLRSAVWDMYCVGALDLRVTPPRCTTLPSERPRSSALARSQLAFGDAVTNQHHDFTRLGDPLSRELFSQLDGQLSHDQLAHRLLELTQAGKLASTPAQPTLEQLKAAIAERLAAWAKHALLES